MLTASKTSTLASSKHAEYYWFLLYISQKFYTGILLNCSVLLSDIKISKKCWLIFLLLTKGNLVILTKTVFLFCYSICIRKKRVYWYDIYYVYFLVMPAHLKFYVSIMSNRSEIFSWVCKEIYRGILLWNSPQSDDCFVTDQTRNLIYSI